MVFRYFLGNMIREAAQQQFHEATENAREAAERAADLKCDILVVMALPIEAGGMVDQLQDVVVTAGDGFTERIGQLGKSTCVGILETGPGQKRAGAATAEVIASREPQWVISAGFAGGLRDELRRGHFLMADSVTQASTNEHIEIGLTMDRDALESSKGVHVGRLLTVDRIIRGVAEKRQLGEQHDAIACDMETFAVARCCQEAKKRFLSVRIIRDAVDDELPKEIDKLLQQENRVAQLGAAAAALWNRPSSAKDMWKLKEDALQASDRLARFLPGVIEQLPIASIDRRSDGNADENTDQ